MSKVRFSWLAAWVVDAFEIINLWHKYALTRNIDVYLVTAYDLTYRRTRDKVE